MLCCPLGRAMTPTVAQLLLTLMFANLDRLFREPQMLTSLITLVGTPWIVDTMLPLKNLWLLMNICRMAWFRVLTMLLVILSFGTPLTSVLVLVLNAIPQVEVWQSSALL